MMDNSLLDAIRNAFPKEIIDGSDVEATAEMVDLDIAFTPVVQHVTGGDPLLDVPAPVEVQKWKDGRYAIMHREHRDYDFVSEASLKIMRARYLILHGFYWRHLHAMSHPMRQEVLALYFGGGVWTPKSGSELSKMMGMK